MQRFIGVFNSNPLFDEEWPNYIEELATQTPLNPCLFIWDFKTQRWENIKRKCQTNNRMASSPFMSQSLNNLYSPSLSVSNVSVDCISGGFRRMSLDNNNNKNNNNILNNNVSLKKNQKIVFVPF